MARPKMPPSFGKPTMATRFYIDFDWWEQEGKDIQLHIKSMSEEFGVEIPPISTGETEPELEWVDPISAHVVHVDQQTYKFLSVCMTVVEFIPERTTLVEAIFRTLLISGNRPMTAEEISERITKPSDTILRTLSGPQIYKGIRPQL